MKWLWCPILSVVMVLAAQGQIINVEAKRLTEDSTGWSGLLDQNLSLIGNTTLLVNLSFGTQVQFRQNKHLWLSVNSVNFIKVSEDPFDNKGFQHFRYGYQATPAVMPEAFSQVQFDQILLIRLRWLLGGGTRFTLLDKKAGTLHMGASYMYEYEEELETGRINRHHRLSMYLNINLKLGERVAIFHINYYQPRLNKFSDYRLSSGTTLTVDVWKGLSFNTTGNFSFDTHPVKDEDIRRFTYSVRNGFSYRF